MRVRYHITALALLTGLMLMACATPVGVRIASEQQVGRELSASALTGERLSTPSSQMLARLNLAERYRRQPQLALQELHAGLGQRDESDRLFVLAELSYAYARRADDRSHALAAAVYAYAFLFAEDATQPPSAYDPRVRLAMGLYGRALTLGLRTAPGGELDLATRRVKLPIGELDLSLDQGDLQYAGATLEHFIALEDYTIHGLRNHYRKEGMGVAMIGRLKPASNAPASPWLSTQAKVPLTLLLNIAQPRGSIRSGHLSGQLELHDIDASPTVRINGSEIPLEADPSAALAYGLNDSPLWDFEIAGFRRGDFNPFGKPAEGSLFFMRAYRPGRIPVIFVHGTASSPARWAQMGNELLSDPAIASRYQLWFFLYNSGNPIALSAMHLREELTQAVKDLDPAGTDPALRQMVVIGHSQGGLLTKMTAVSSGTRFWDVITSQSFASAKLTSDTRDLLQRSLFVEPLPSVRRLVFIATPHGGSYMAEDFLGKMARRFISLPATLSKSSLELIKLNPSGAVRTAFRMPTAIDNMDSHNPFLRTLRALPIDPAVHAHSIIPVKGKGPVEKGADGVVRYSSAHIEGVDSELVVSSGHSCQATPQAIEEVRRILMLHLEQH